MTASTLPGLRTQLPLLGLGLIQAAATLWALRVSLQYSDDFTCALINIGLFAVPLLAVLAASGRWRIALTVATLLSLLAWGAGELKLKYFDNRLALLDFYFIGQSANWTIIARYPRLQAAVAGFIVLAAALIARAWFAPRGTPLNWRLRTVCVAALAGWAVFAWQNRYHHTWQVFRDDADCGKLQVCGVMSRLVFSYNVFERPDALPAHDTTLFSDQARALPPVPVAAGGAKPDVVVWLNESTFDPRGYQIEGAQWPKLKMFDKRAETRAQGLLRVHTYGGKTWLSEFSMLTGLVPDDFGARRNLVFNSVTPHVQPHLVERFRASGYRTVVLMPTFKRFYGAGRIYEQLGFDQVLTLRDFPEYDGVPGDEWDIATSPRLAEAAVTLLKRNALNTGDPRPLFLYMLSIHEHAPYPKDTPVLPGLVHAGLPKSLKGKLSDYSNKMVTLDGSIDALETYLKQQPRRTLWAYFGDHQAYFEEAQPAYALRETKPDFITQYQLRSNYRPINPVDSPALLDIALLPSLIADTAGLARNDYFDGLSAMRRLCDGKLEDCPQKPLLDSFKGWVYRPELAVLRY